jgi:hypothetical protein
MIIWLIALVLLGVMAYVGQSRGAVRLGVALAGVILGALVARPLTPMIEPLLNMAGVTNLAMQQVIGPLAIVALALIGASILAEVVHRKVEFYYKYRVEDIHRVRWEHLNKRLGICVGVASGAVYFLLLMIPVYSLGYLTHQLSPDGQDGAIGHLNRARVELHETGFDRVVAAYAPYKTTYYQTADILGLLYRNPLLQNRLFKYPPLLEIVERDPLKQFGNDADINNNLQRQAPFMEILQHQRVEAIVNDRGLLADLHQLVASDLEDLHTYLLTGKSPKYSEEPILGLWLLDLRATVAEEILKNPDISTFELNQVRMALQNTSRGLNIITTPDQKAVLRRQAAKDAEQREQARGTWQRASDGTYLVTWPRNRREETIRVRVEGEHRLSAQLTGLGLLIFERDM